MSGKGFLGAGIIFRGGFEVHGLNTAATLWCSAGVGLLAGEGAWPFAMLLTGLVVFINHGLRQLVKLLKKYTAAGTQVQRAWVVSLTCRPEDEGHIRSLTIGGPHLSEMTGQTSEGSVDLTAVVTADGVTDLMFEAAVTRIAAEPGLTRLRWSVPEDARLGANVPLRACPYGPKNFYQKFSRKTGVANNCQKAFLPSAARAS